MESWKTLVAAASLSLVSGCDQTAAPLTPDSTVAFHCSEVPSSLAIVAFMRTHGFVACDEENARRRSGTMFFPLQIDGIDSRHVLFEFVGLQQPPSRGRTIDYQMTITSPPPTRRDIALERDATRFIERALRCRIATVSRGENGAGSAAQFQLVFRERVRAENEISK